MTDPGAARRRLEALQTAWLAQPGNLRGAVWMTISACGFTCNNALIKALYGQGLDPFQVALARSVFALVALLPLLYSTGFGVLRTKYPGIHFLRGLFGGGAMLCGFYAVTQLPLAEMTALSFTTPLFMIVLAVVLLREPVRWRRWTATVVGFIGVLIMVRPGAEAFDPAAIVALGMAFGIAMAVTLLKRLPPGESHIAMLFYFCIVAIAMAAVPAALVWQDASLVQWLLMALVGFLGVGSQGLLIRAFRAGEATFVAPFDYSKILVAGILGFFLFGEVPDALGLTGAAVIIASTVYIARREAGMNRRVAPEA